MKRLDHGGYTLTGCVGAAMLTGWGALPLIGTPGATPQTSTPALFLPGSRPFRLRGSRNDASEACEALPVDGIEYPLRRHGSQQTLGLAEVTCPTERTTR
ncbi:MAG: hypothetical protein WB644_10015 [Candidatus Cybelea sp.]